LNLEILNPEVQQFISDNLHEDVSKLLFRGSPFETISIQELVTQIVSKKKCEKKLQNWYQTEYIYYPPKVHIEQTSSEITAAYKSSLVSGHSIIDITGGFGVDCYYFSKKLKKVTHCELDTNLSTIVKNNYQQLKIDNIHSVSGDGIDFLKSYESKFDWIYIDPSRRDAINQKVFLLKDCLPNVPENLELLFSKSNQILIKNSPILDISKTIKELRFVKEIHIVAIHNEVKELLFILEKDYEKTIHIKTINYTKKNTQIFDFQYLKNNSSNYTEPKKYIYEPKSAILKSGGFHEVSAQLNLEKLHQHSHLYTSEKHVEFPGRTFLVKDTCSYNKKEIKKILKDNKANITTRNFPETVAQIRKKTKIKDGGSNYLFFTTVNNNKHIVLICSQVF
jgi:16S rRNA G966 N2-methylase RsmD